jgi:type III secretory pathway component EscU
MSQQTKLKLRIIAIIIVLLAVGMQLNYIIVPGLSDYTFWLVVSSFILLLVAGR